MKKLLFILVILLASFFRITAQRFPVVVVPQVNTPAPVNFYDYANGTTLNSPLSVQLLFNDITVSDRQIRLKVFFEGQGINFESRDVVVGASPLFISGGGPPLVLSNVELAPYFEFQNIQGINPNVYRESIPEGNYQFCFEVFEFNTGAKLSSKTCVPVFIFNNQPPLLNLPYNGINIKPDAVDNILFQWTPRHINVGNVSYKFSIVEIWDDRVDPQTSFLSVPPIFETTTSATSFLYGPSQPLLLPSKRYAWRVQAQALVGAEEVGLFKNEGKSEIFWFSRSEPCKTLLEVTAEPKGISKINVFWEEDASVFTEYTIAYREAKRENSKWFTKTTNSAWATIWDLKPGTTYEYKVRAKCKYQTGEYSEIQEVTTNQKESDTDHYQCGITPDVISITNRDPHAGLSVGDRVVAGEFLVTITEIENQANGRITGKGFVPIPYLNKVRFGVTFSNILINTENQLAEGVITTFYDEKFGEGTSFDVDLDTDVTEIITGDTGVFKEESIAFEIKNVEINEDGAIEITGVDGETAIIKGDQNVVITDSEGTPWRVNKEDEVSKETAAEGGAVTANNTSGVTKEGEVEALSNTIEVNFVSSGFYAFDQLPDGASAAMENEYSTVVNDKNEKETLAFKAIAKLKGEDIVKAKVDFKDSGITKKDLIFKTSSGIAIPQLEWNDNETEVSLKLKNKSSYLNEQLLATVKKKGKEVFEIVGALNLTHLGNENVQNIKLSIVPINNANVNTSVKTKLNEIYNKVGVSFEVTITEAFQIPETIWNVENETASQLDIGDSSILKLYTPEENAIKDYFKSQFNYQKDHYYVFVTDLPTSAPDTNGFMPLKGQFGFVFTKNDRARTIAHELGHGIFGLTHPFTSYNTPQGSTTLLMDYGKGELLNHMDWKQIHAPGFKLYNFQNDAAGESKKGQSDDEKMLVVLNHIKENLNKKSQDVLKWKQLSRKKRNGQASRNADYGLKEKEYSLKTKNDVKLNFKLVSQPDPLEELQISLLDKIIKFDKKDAYGFRKEIIGFEGIHDISYQLTFKDTKKTNAFTLEFDHYNDIEQFFKFLNQDSKSYVFANTETSKQITTYLLNNFIADGDISKENDCNDIDLFFAEAPSSLLKDPKIISEESLWGVLKALLKCAVDDKGVSEEKAVITIIEALGNGPSDTTNFLDRLFSEKINDTNLFKLLYQKVDNWGGEDNFTAYVDVMYTIWRKSNTYAKTKAAVQVPYTNEKRLGFYFSKFDLNLNEDYSKIEVIENYSEIVRSSQSRQQTRAEIRNFGNWGVYDPVEVVDYSKITDAGFQVASTTIPMFLLKAIANNHSTSNIDRGANFAFEAAVTVSGIGNITKLRHLRHLNKLDELLKGLQGVETSLSTVSLVLKYSDVCTKEKKDSTDKKEKTYCEKLEIFTDALGLFNAGNSIGGKVAQRANIEESTRDLIDVIEDNPSLIADAGERAELLKALEASIGNASVVVEDLTELRKMAKDKVLNQLINESFGLTVSSMDFLLKISDCSSDLCKEMQLYLGVVQKALKAKALSTKIATQAKSLLTKIKSNPNAIKEISKREEVVKDLESVVQKVETKKQSLPEDLQKEIEINKALDKLFVGAEELQLEKYEAAWNALSDSPTLRQKSDNIEVISETALKFQYKENSGFYGIETFFKEITSGKQRLIDELKIIDDTFKSDYIKIEGQADNGRYFDIKDISDNRVATYRKGKLEPLKVLKEFDEYEYEVISIYKEYKVVEKEGEIWFVKN